MVVKKEGFDDVTKESRGHSNPDFFLHEKTGNNLLGINSSTWRIVYRIRDQRVRSEGKTSALVERRTEREISSSSGPRRRRRFQLMPEIERTCFDIRLLIDPSLSFFPLLSLFFFTRLYNSTKHTFILLLFKCLTSFDYLLHVHVGKILREKYGEMLDSERKNRRKTKNCLDGG